MYRAYDHETCSPLRGLSQTAPGLGYMGHGWEPEDGDEGRVPQEGIWSIPTGRALRTREGMTHQSKAQHNWMRTCDLWAF